MIDNLEVKKGLSLNSLANVLEVGRRILLKSKSEDFCIPEGANVEEDLAAAVGSAIAVRKIKEGIK